MSQSYRRSLFEDTSANENRRGSIYNVDQMDTQRRISNKQAINLFKILDKYSKPAYKDPQQSSRTNNQDNQYHRRTKSHKINNNALFDGDNSMSSRSSMNQSSKISLMLEKEIYNLKADLNRLKAIEFEQNKKYQDKIFSMMQDQFRYPPPNILFGDSQTVKAGMGQPFLFF